MGAKPPPKFTLSDEESYQRQEKSKRRQEEDCRPDKRQKRGEDPDSGNGEQTTETVTETREDRVEDRQTVEQTQIQQCNTLSENSTERHDSYEVSPNLFSVKITTMPKQNSTSFDKITKNANKITDYFQQKLIVSLSGVSGGCMRGKVRQGFNQEVIKGGNFDGSGVIVLKQLAITSPEEENPDSCL